MGPSEERRAPPTVTASPLGGPHTPRSQGPPCAAPLLGDSPATLPTRTSRAVSHLASKDLLPRTKKGHFRSNSAFSKFS